MEAFEQIEPTKQEIFNEKSSRMLKIKELLKYDDYKHSRHLRETQLNIALTLSEEEYTAFCLAQQVIVDEFNTLETECRELELLIKQESEESISNGK